MSDISNKIPTQVRIDSELFNKAKILAAICGKSFNAFLCDLVAAEIERYEKKHGELPKPLQ